MKRDSNSLTDAELMRLGRVRDLPHHELIMHGAMAVTEADLALAEECGREWAEAQR